MNWLKTFLKNLKPAERFGTGAIEDERPQAEREKDFRFEEIVASATPVDWREKPQGEWRKFPIFNQNGSGSCVAQTLAKLLGVLYWLKNGNYVHFSATHIYQRRANKPNSGMWGIDALDIARKGVTLEVLAPSQEMTDAQMDSVEIETYKQEVGEIFRIGNYVVLPMNDIETIASVIQTTGKAVMVWYRFNYDEWTDIPQVKTTAPTLHHSVAAVDFILHEGKKALVIEDSWGIGSAIEGRRIITEDFHKARNTFAAYPINFAFEETPTPEQKPRHTFARDLKFRPIFAVDSDVKALQDILKYEGLFPKNVESTGYYGAVTAKAVLAFQKKHKVADDMEIDALAGRVVGEKTRSKLNELYGSN